MDESDATYIRGGARQPAGARPRHASARDDSDPATGAQSDSAETSGARHAAVSDLALAAGSCPPWHRMVAASGAGALEQAMR